MQKAFTLIELVVVVSMIAVLAVLTLSVTSSVHGTFESATCIHSLQQLSAATELYLEDHSHVYFPYVQNTAEGKLWYFGLEPWGSVGQAEGSRTLDTTKGVLAPYLDKVGQIAICPAFPYNSALWKPKFKGASYGYGYNIFLGYERTTMLQHPSQIIVFGDCAQVNTFQAPASPKHPMIEEFYMIDNAYQTVHFRHGQVAEFVFADGHLEALPMEKGTLDTRLPEANIGRITPIGSMKYLQ
jgi:prepilin-type N-terminal cleavage/methylation domain-containing protein